MSETSEDKELQAISQIINALDSLDIEEKKRVLDYVFNRIGLKNIKINPAQSGSGTYKPDNGLTESVSHDGLENNQAMNKLIDIRSLAKQKNPKTAIQMAVVVAYYLSELAPNEERKTTINSDDVTKYFKQADFKLPKGRPIYTLSNAKNAGYLELAGETGSYKLNPVGYNLVVHNLPSSSVIEASKRTVKKTKSKKGKDKKNRK